MLSCGYCIHLWSEFCSNFLPVPYAIVTFMGIIEYIKDCLLYLSGNGGERRPLECVDLKGTKYAVVGYV